MSRSSPEGITLLLRRCREGSPAAEQELWPVLYRELKILARSVLRGRAGRPRLGTTTLVHEAYLRLLGPAAADLEWNDRGHFFAVAARAMRFVLVDDARRRLAGKRDGVDTRAEIPEDAVDPIVQPPEDVLAVHGALERLARIHPRYEQLVEMRYFAGLSVEQAAESLGLSRATAYRHWTFARAWLRQELT